MNLSEIIVKLERRGMTQIAIGAAIGCSGATVNRIKHGKQRAGYDVGKRLEELAGKAESADHGIDPSQCPG